MASGSEREGLMGLRKDSPKVQKEPRKINIGQARYRLVGGPYKAPRVKIGQIVKCAVRGDVRIVGMTDAPNPWPIGQTKRAKSLVVCGSLLKALGIESGPAIRHHWGIGQWVVNKWRKVLGIEGRYTAGQKALQLAYSTGDQWREEVMPKLYAKLSDPARAEKIRQAKLGVPRSAETIEKMRAANLGKKLSKATRKKMSEAKRGAKWKKVLRQLHQSNVGRKHTEASKQKMRDVLRARREQAVKQKPTSR